MIYSTVIVIGGGPVGLSTAISLSRQGIKTLIIERSTHVSDHPKARGITARTMELFRQWGVEDAMRTHSFPPRAARFTWMTDFTGSIITHVNADNSIFTNISPTGRALVSQDKVEEVLWDRISTDPNISVLQGHEASVINQDTNHVSVEIRNLSTNSRQIVTASYVVAADGAHSRVRESLGIKMSGIKMGAHCSVYCRMDLSPWLKEGHSVGFFITSARGAGKVLISGNAGDLWVVIFRINGDVGEREQFTPEYCLQEIRKFLGIEDLVIELKTVNFWAMSALVADKFSERRVFLAGDAAHCVPPTGGYGMNLGIQDAHNLAWKLAYVLNGYADQRLLETYTPERQAQAQKVINWSTPNNLRIIEIYKAAYTQDFERMNHLLKEQSKHLNSSGLDLGFHYTSDAVAPCEEAAPEMIAGSYQPTTYPGFRAPHVWLRKPSGEQLSTLDLFDRDYVFLTAAAKGTWENLVMRLQRRTKIPLQIWRIASDGDYRIASNGDHNDTGDFLKVYGITQTGCVLVRPDGHIAWRGEVNSDDTEQQLYSLMALIHPLAF